MVHTNPRRLPRSKHKVQKVKLFANDGKRTVSHDNPGRLQKITELSRGGYLYRLRHFEWGYREMDVDFLQW